MQRSSLSIQYYTRSITRIQSLKPKLPELRIDLCEVHRLDLLALSETWLTDSIPSRHLKIDGYTLHRHDLLQTSKLMSGLLSQTQTVKLRSVKSTTHRLNRPSAPINGRIVEGPWRDHGNGIGSAYSAHGLLCG